MRFIFFFFIFFITQYVFPSELLMPKIFKKASFTQERYIKASHIYLRSSGLLYLREGNELVWEQKKPFVFKMIIEKGKIFNMEGGKKIEVKNASVLIMATIINDLLKGNIKPLKEKFKLEKKGKELKILPIEKILKKIIKEIKVIGDHNIEKFILKEKSGNVLELKFSDHELRVEK